MKYLLVLADGMADWKCPEIDGKTPAEFANTPNMDRTAREGRCGMVKTVPDGFVPGSDVANLGVLGYEPAKCYTGRGPLEALSMGVDVKGNNIAYRCNLVTIENGIMADFSADHITSEESKELFKELNEKIPHGKNGAVGYPGVSYRNLLVVEEGFGETETKAPHDIVGEKIDQYLPDGKDAELLLECIEISKKVFAESPVNKKRIAEGKKPATQIWPWSGGKKPAVESFQSKYGHSGAMISAVDLLKGIGVCADMEIIDVPGATGYFDTDYKAKADYALKAFKAGKEFVYLHVEAPDEAGHEGNLREKVLAVERIDSILGFIREEMEKAGEDLTIAVLPDHPTPIAHKTHTSEPVPFAVCGKGFEADGCTRYCEAEISEKGSFGLIDAKDFLYIVFGIKKA